MIDKQTKKIIEKGKKEGLWFLETGSGGEWDCNYFERKLISPLKAERYIRKTGQEYTFLANHKLVCPHEELNECEAELSKIQKKISSLKREIKTWEKNL